MMARRDATATRRTLLEAAFWEMYRKGFHAASLDTILRATGVTKGALYHHFPSKAALGHAVLDEVVDAHVARRWTDALDGADDPVEALRQVLTVRVREIPEEEVMLGCPLNNLALELSPVDEDFRIHAQKLFNRWRSAIGYALVRGQEAGTVRPDVDAGRAAAFILAGIEGSLSLAKNAQSEELLRQNLETLSRWVEGLRARSG